MERIRLKYYVQAMRLARVTSEIADRINTATEYVREEFFRVEGAAGNAAAQGYKAW